MEHCSRKSKKETIKIEEIKIAFADIRRRRTRRFQQKTCSISGSFVADTFAR